jgi:hypothetical protein
MVRTPITWRGQILMALTALALAALWLLVAPDGSLPVIAFAIAR